MNTKSEGTGISTARKHVYFYTLLILLMVVGNSIKNWIKLPAPAPLENRVTAEINHVLKVTAIAQNGDSPSALRGR